ncbi:MAG: biopolymer transporter ExbD [Sinobacteraceae bacterium]|nr:biopolymer transporter ExbD [Nevskiaceae bacterium]
MQAHRHDPGDEHHGIDLAPMLDFVLNLLIFFIIITSFVKQTGVKVIQPQAQTSQHVDTGNILIAVRPNGDIWMDRQKVTLPQVRAMIERMHAERPEDTVVITADKDSQTGVVMKVMEQVKLGGISTVSIAAQHDQG